MHSKIDEDPEATSCLKVFYNRRNEVGVLETGPHLNLNGTHFLDDTWCTSRDRVIKLLGEPTYIGSIDDKVQNSWHCRFFKVDCFTGDRREWQIKLFKERILKYYHKPENPSMPQGFFYLNSHGGSARPMQSEREEFCVYDWKHYEEICDEVNHSWHVGSSGINHKKNINTWLDFMLPYGLIEVFSYGFYMKTDHVSGLVCSKEEYYADE